MPKYRRTELGARGEGGGEAYNLFGENAGRLALMLFPTLSSFYPKLRKPNMIIPEDFLPSFHEKVTTAHTF